MATWFSGQAHDPVCAGTKGMHVRLGCLRDRGLLYRDIDFEPCVATGIQFRDRVWGWARFGSRQGSPYVTTEFSQG